MTTCSALYLSDPTIRIRICREFPPTDSSAVREASLCSVGKTLYSAKRALYSVKLIHVYDGVCVRSNISACICM